MSEQFGFHDGIDNPQVKSWVAVWGQRGAHLLLVFWGQVRGYYVGEDGKKVDVTTRQLAKSSGLSEVYGKPGSYLVQPGNTRPSCARKLTFIGCGVV